MVVAQTFELFGGEHICEEAENLHVSELNIVCALFQMRIVQMQDAIGNANIPSLLRLILEFDHAYRYLRVYMHTFQLVNVVELLSMHV